MIEPYVMVAIMAVGVAVFVVGVVNYHQGRADGACEARGGQIVSGACVRVTELDGGAR